MPLDPNLILSQQPVAPPLNPINLADAWSKLQEVRAQAAQRMQTVSDNAAIAQAYKDLGQNGQIPDPFTVATHLEASGQPRAGNTVRTQALDAQKQMLANEQASTKVQSDTASFASQQVQAAIDNPALYPSVKPKVEALLGSPLPDPSDPQLTQKLQGIAASGQTVQQQLEAKTKHLALIDSIQKGNGDARTNAMSILAGATDPGDYQAKLGHIIALTPPDYREALATIPGTWAPGTPNPAIAATEAGEKGVVIPQGATLARPVTGTTIAQGTPERTMETYDVGGENVRLATDKAGRAYAPDGRPISPGANGWTYADGSAVDPHALPKAAIPASIIVQQSQPAAGGLADEALNRAATTYHTTGQLPPMGMGAQGVVMRKAIMNKEAELFPDPTSLAANSAAFKANQSTLAQLTKQQAAVEAYSETAGKNLKLFTDLADKVPDTGVPWVNLPLRVLNKNVVGSQNQAAFDAARQVALTEIAKVVNNPGLTGSLSDSARSEVMGLNSSSATFAQIKSVANVLQQDMANRQSGLADQIQGIKDRLKAAGARDGPPTGGPSTSPQPQANAPIQYGGHTFTPTGLANQFKSEGGNLYVRKPDGTFLRIQ